MRDSLESRTGSEEDGDQHSMVDKTKNKCDSSWVCYENCFVDVFKVHSINFQIMIPPTIKSLQQKEHAK